MSGARILAAFAALAMAVLGTSTVLAKAPLLIVISLDGFRADYFDRGLTPTLAQMAREGVHAQAMRPSFPSVTEPNHYTLMTGLYPDHHGIVDNTMVDPAMPGIAFGGPHDQGADNDPRWWNQATPLWVTAERAGLKTATSFWPGDGAIVQGIAPTYRQAPPSPRPLIFPMDKQLDAVFAWLDLPVDRRPVLIRLHLDITDLMGHLAGPDSAGVNDAIAKTDAALGRLRQGLETRGLWDGANIVVVSDHGMAPISAEKTILLDDLIDLKTVVVTTYGAEGGVDPLPGHEAAVEKALLAPRAHMTCWTRHSIPARLHYGANPRVPAVFCLADLGWTITTKAEQARFPQLRGNHGYDPAEPTMAAFFLAEGPSFRRGYEAPAFDNIDVYSLLAKVMGLKPRPNDGHLADVAPMLRP